MATQHRARKGTSVGAAGRFGRQGAPARGPGAARTRRSTTVTTRGRGGSRGRKAQRSSGGGVIHMVGGLLGGAGTSAARSRGAGKGAKAGAGVAMLTAAAGLAFKNRDKLGGLLRRDHSGDTPPQRASGPPAGTTGDAVHSSAAATPGAADGTGTATPLADPAPDAPLGSDMSDRVEAPLDPALGGVAGDRLGEPLDPPIGDPSLDRLGGPVNAPDMPPVGDDDLARREEGLPPRDA
jgi:hypothetical protein